jgi:hypothetical protein
MDETLKSLLGGLFGTQLGGLVSGIGQAALTERGIQDIGQARQEANIFFGGQPDLPTFEGGLMGEIGRQSQFKPFTVTTPTGAAATLGATGMQAQLSPEEMGLMRSVGGFAQGAFETLGSPEQRLAEQQAIIGMLTPQAGEMAAREADIFQRLEAMQAPERERAALQLEERLFGQGRGGVRTSMFGGTPEQLALSKAIEEQRAASAVSAMEQARAEQALRSQQTLAGLGETRARLGLLGELGLAAIPTAYTPQQELLRALTPQLEASRLATILQSAGLSLGAGIAESAIESQLGFESLKNALRQQQYQGLFDLLRGEQQRQTASQPTQLTGAWNEFMGMTQEALRNQAQAAARQAVNPQGTPTVMADGTIVYL